jgi:hypothetical protein
MVGRFDDVKKGDLRGTQVGVLHPCRAMRVRVHLLADAGFQMVRYADDFVILCRSEEAAAEALRLVVQPECSPCFALSTLSQLTPPTGEPDAGDPQVRFGGRGNSIGPSYPYHWRG